MGAFLPPMQRSTNDVPATVHVGIVVLTMRCSVCLPNSFGPP